MAATTPTRTVVALALVLVLSACCVPHAARSATADGPRRNILYIVVDDLRVDLPMYGQDYISAPHLQQLAAKGVTFLRAYVQQAWNFKTSFRDVGPDWETLPGHFLHHGYLTLGTGKLFHEGLPANGDGARSWTNSSLQFSCHNSTAKGAATYCDPKMQSCEDTRPIPDARWCTGPDPAEGGVYADLETLADFRVKLKAAASGYRATGQPFFLGLGLRKPHLDFRSPQQFVDIYNASGPRAARPPLHDRPAAGMPDIAYHDVARNPGERKQWGGYGFVDPWIPMPTPTTLAIRQHYYAAISFTDSIVGAAMAAVADEGLANEVIVCFHSDHGWTLGEQNMFRKFHNAELATRVPLIIASPFHPATHGHATTALAELVDVFPTLSDLAGLPRPPNGSAPLAGVSLAPLLLNSSAPGKGYALSQYPRCPTNTSRLWSNNWCIDVAAKDFGWFGYSIRTDTHRYNAWCPWDGQALRPRFPAQRANGTDGFFEELYEYDSRPELDLDALDVVDVSAQQPEVADRLFEQLKQLVTPTPHPA